MNSKSPNPHHLANQNRWNAAAERWSKQTESRGIWKACVRNPEIVFCEKVMNQLTEISGKKVCVLGSGDNQAVFALAGMGAKVTSVDISEKQLEFAARRAEILGFDIEFVQSDVTDLKAFSDEQFDLVYTGGHVAVWVSDLKKYYSEAVRILKPGGIFIVDEYHPFRRIWKETEEELVIEIPYFEKGPFRYFLNDNILESAPGNFESFEFHWTVSDFLNAVLKAGCRILETDEYGNHVGDWERTNFEGLPENLLIIGEKSEGIKSL